MEGVSQLLTEPSQAKCPWDDHQAARQAPATPAVAKAHHRSRRELWHADCPRFHPQRQSSWRRICLHPTDAYAEQGSNPLRDHWLILSTKFHQYDWYSLQRRHELTKDSQTLLRCRVETHSRPLLHIVCWSYTKCPFHDIIRLLIGNI